MSFPAPSHAYIPGKSPRHPECAFDAFRLTVHADMAPTELAQCDAWQAALQYFDQGYFWEAHELMEPVWMTLRTGPERELVQGMIQLANAALKQRMERPRAVLRLCDLVDRHLDAVTAEAAITMGVSLDALKTRCRSLRASVNLPG